MQTKLDHAMKDVTDKYMMLEEAEKSAVRTALIEERSRFCLFISCLRPFVVSFQELPYMVNFSWVKLKRPKTCVRKLAILKRHSIIINEKCK